MARSVVVQAMIDAEIAGILSHGAIVTREYGIPAVIGVRGITQAVTIGQMITVDGNRGWVYQET